MHREGQLLKDSCIVEPKRNSVESYLYKSMHNSHYLHNVSLALYSTVTGEEDNLVARRSGLYASIIIPNNKMNAQGFRTPNMVMPV